MAGEDSAHAGRLESLFARALELDPRERRAWLESLSGEDAALRGELDSLLVHLERSSRFLARPPAPLAFLAAMPERIASFRILRELGAGGMGIVYLAEQEKPRREVALKVVRAGLATAEALRRFEHEAAALARLQHPNIAQIFEAGTADWGAGPQPYFAMELVAGTTLSEHVRARACDVRERLMLLAQACDALEHAHGRGVVHRDLKPSNLLVETISGQTRVKLLDFGVARVTDVGIHSASRLTNAGQVLGTLSYMSPEQASGDPLGVDARSDVYSLGAIGYELFAGEPPLDVLGLPLHEAVRIVCDEEPEPLTSRGPRIDREIETIFSKALDKDPLRRYASAHELAADLRRHLQHLPILARPPSRAYRLVKFTRRHRALVTGVGLVLLALSGGLLATLRQKEVAASERDRADDEARVARAVAEFQRDMLSRVDPEVDGRDARLVDVLDGAQAALPGELAGLPAAEAGVRAMLGASYQSLGLPREARAELERAVELSTLARGAEHDETLRARATLASVLADLGRTAEARAESEAVWRAWVARHGERDPEALVLELNLVKLRIELGEVDGEDLVRRNLELRREVFGESHAEFVNGLSALGQLLWTRDRFDEAEPLLRRALEVGAALQGDEHPRTLQRRAELASLLVQTGRLEEAEPLLRAALESGRRVFGPEHAETLVFEHNLGALLERAGRPAEAEALFRAVIEAQARALGPDHPEGWTARGSLAGLLYRQGRCAEAEPLFAAILESQQRVLSEDDPELASTRTWLERTRERLARGLTPPE